MTMTRQSVAPMAVIVALAISSVLLQTTVFLPTAVAFTVPVVPYISSVARLPMGVNHHNTAPSRLVLLSASSSSSSEDQDNQEATPEPEGDEPIDLRRDDRLYKVRLPSAPGIDWGTDLSFCFVSVRSVDPAGAASMEGVQKGDQLCQLQTVGESPKTVNLLGASFDYVMETFASLGNKVPEIDLVFFRGTKEELKKACTSADEEPEVITITVIQNKGSPEEKTIELQAPAGSNVRKVCVDNGINVYQSITRWTNCKGKQLCGTCIVNIKEGGLFTNRKSMDEASTLRENPDSYRLSCVTFAYGDVTVETFPPVQAAQWTR